MKESLQMQKCNYQTPICSAFEGEQFRLSL